MLDALEGRSAALMANHGAITFGDDLAPRSSARALLEWACTVYWRAAAIGDAARARRAERSARSATAVAERGYGASRGRRTEVKALVHRRPRARRARAPGRGDPGGRRRAGRGDPPHRRGLGRRHGARARQARRRGAQRGRGRHRRGRRRAAGAARARRRRHLAAAAPRRRADLGERAPDPPRRRPPGVARHRRQRRLRAGRRRPGRGRRRHSRAPRRARVHGRRGRGEGAGARARARRRHLRRRARARRAGPARLDRARRSSTLDYLLPNREQVLGFTGAADVAEGSRALLDRGARCVVADAAAATAR